MAVDKLVDSTVLDGYFEDIADAIRGKNGSSDTYTPAQMPQAITDIPSGGGGGPVEEKDVNFIDYDGSIIYSYTADEFLELTELPANPSHNGLTAQGWNWTLQQAQDYVGTCGILVVGQNYITDDEKTRVYITLEDNQLDIQLGLGVNGSATINWGDGNTSTITGTNINAVSYSSHSYSYSGDYVISIDVASGNQAAILGLGSRTYLIIKDPTANAYVNDSYRNSINKVELGKNISLNQYAFAYCYSLKSVSIPNTTSISDYNGSMFYYCYSLAGLVIPTSVNTIWRYTFTQCKSVRYVSIPPTVFQIYGQAFYTTSVKMLTLGDLTYIDSGPFSSSDTLRKCSIKSYNSTSTTSVQNTFNYCYSLSECDLSRTTFKTLQYTFSNCYALKKVKLPTSLTTINMQTFYNCYCLSSIEIPENVTTINNQAFYNCNGLTKITIPENVTSIGAQAFASCYGLTEIHFKPTTPPTLPHSNVFANLPSSCIIYVPRGYLSAYTSATNYPLDSTYTYVEE
jgi:hypothetical protein